MSWLDEVKWDRDGLVPAIAQEVGTNDVLMLAFVPTSWAIAGTRPSRSHFTSSSQLIGSV